MTDKQPQKDFETQWQEKLSRGIGERAGERARDLVLEGGAELNAASTARERLAWTCRALECLEEFADLKTRQEILAGCHCSYPVEDLLNVKMAYRVTEDLDQALAALQEKFVKFLREGLELEGELVESILERGWGLAGVREGKTIIATKIPKSAYIRDYFKEEDPLKRRRLYCHCPRVREELGSEPGLPLEYCYCGAGYYQGIWEEILGQPVEVEVLESVLGGDEVCTIAVHIH
jgi:hypothetical protein